MQQAYETLDLRLDRGLLWLRLNRPDHMNAFSVTMARELEAAFRAASVDDEVSVIVVTGAGRAFCAGMDLAAGGNVFGLDEKLTPTLQDLVDRGDEPAYRDHVRDTGGRVTLAIHDCRKPVVAAINGVAVGIGATMTLAMDFRLASETARLGFVFGKLGITPEACSTWFLPRLVGLERAMEWCLSARIFPASEGLEAGLVRSIHAPEDLLAAAETFARGLVEGRSAAAIALTRQLLRRNMALTDPADAHRLESLAVFYASLADGKEGVQAFLEKRPPVFRSKASQLPDFAEQWLAEEEAREG